MIKRTPFLIALLNPLNLAMLALVGAAGLCSAWWLIFPGMTLWLVMFLVIAKDPTLQFSYILENRAPLASRFQKKFEPINRSLTRLFNTIRSSKTRLRRQLQPVLKTSVELVDRAYGLCLRLTPMENNRLVTQNTGGLLLELENIQTKIDNTEDPVIKREYQDAYHSIRERLEKMDTFDTQLERVDAQLVSLKNDMDNLLATVVSLQSRPVSEARKEVQPILDQLGQEIQAFQSFEKEINI